MITTVSIGGGHAIANIKHTLHISVWLIHYVILHQSSILPGKKKYFENYVIT